ncbi:hypothetical protein F5B20DRAFT_567325 [Whalleya microplaca]|nr:hypothetical protein F5B20DRAFT_567325 [Whalleya microplaca]
MADPLSLPASTAGLVSLGLDLCKGLVAYTDAIKCRDEEISSSKRLAKTFQDSIQALRAFLVASQSQYPNGITRCSEALNTCNAQLIALDELLDEIGCVSGPRGSFRVKLKKQGQVMSYAFRRDNLERLETRLTRANEAVQTSLQILQMEIQFDSNKRLDNIETTTADTLTKIPVIGSDIATINTNLLHVQGSQAGLGNVLQRVQTDVARTSTELPIIQSRLDSVSASVIGTQAILPAIQTMVDAIAPMKSSLLEQRLAMERIMDALNITPDNHARGRKTLSSTVAGRLSKPSILKAVHDELNVSNSGNFQMDSVSSSLESILDPGQKPQGGTLTSYMTETTCFCRTHRYLGRKTLRLGPINFFGETRILEQHLPGCRLSQVAGRQHTRAFGLTYTGLRALVNNAIRFSFLVSSGAGGFSISPNVTYYPTVDQASSPTFRILYSLKLNALKLVSKTQWDELIGLSLRQIWRAFRDGKASPQDVDQFDRSLLHELTGLIRRAARASNELQDKGVVGSALRLVRGILDYGVRTIECDDMGQSPIYDLILSGDLGATVCDMYLSAGPETPEVYESVTASTLSQFDTVRFLTASRKAAEAWNFGILSCAILTQDEAKIKAILSRYPSAMKETNFLRLSPLHLAADKPACLRLLINHSAGLINQEARDGRTPLGIALTSSKTLCCSPSPRDLCCKECCCTSCVQMLLEADCSMSREFWPGFPLEFKEATPRCKLIFIEHLKSRRDRLRTLAWSHLAGTELTPLLMTSEFVLDAGADKVIMALSKLGVQVPEALVVTQSLDGKCSPGWSVYHGITDPNDAELFYKAGFRDMHTPDCRGIRPLGYTYTKLSMRAWLIEHGADPFQHVPPFKFCSKTAVSGSTYAHHIFSLVSELDFPFQRWSSKIPMDSDSKKAFETVGSSTLGSNITDQCACACAVQGCTPLISLLKNVLGYINDGRSAPAIALFHDNGDLGALAHYFTEFLDHYGREMSLGSYTAEPIIRFLTFEGLSITHTCCRISRYYLSPIASHSPDEIRDILELESAERELLEDIITELEDGLSSLAVGQLLDIDAFKVFLKSRWVPQVEKALAKVKSQQEIARGSEADDLGVVWEPSRPSRPYFEERGYQRAFREMIEILPPNKDDADYEYFQDLLHSHEAEGGN